MEHEISKEDLSAFLDEELEPSRNTAIENHLKSCAECSGELDRLRGASAAFRAAGSPPAPARLAGAVLRGKGPKRVKKPNLVVKWAMSVAFCVFLFLTMGKMFKPAISQMFKQILAQVSGAVSSVGSGN